MKLWILRPIEDREGDGFILTFYIDSLIFETCSMSDEEFEEKVLLWLDNKEYWKIYTENGSKVYKFYFFKITSKPDTYSPFNDLEKQFSFQISKKNTSRFFEKLLELREYQEKMVTVETMDFHPKNRYSNKLLTTK